MPNKHTSSGKETYHIKVKGYLDIKWQDWFDCITIKHLREDETLLIGMVEDQSALNGMLARIHSLGLCLLSVNRVESSEDQPPR